MATASDVTIALVSDDVPFPPTLPPARADDALRWGDDYELLFTLPAGTEPPVHATRIGVVMERGDSPVLLDGAVPHGRLGYLHD
jgi:thiamine-monophosphate kinase